ncbi:MAG TPA: GNAT family N-acetyltransferase [Chryseolinea sp.]|nr:GNAT family N-acetyltransferase [Chryseolinea sp.]
MISLQLPEQLASQRLLIRRLRYEDAEEIFYAYASKPEATRFVSWPTHTSIADTKSFLRYAVASWKCETDFAFGVRLKSDSRLIGGFGVVNDNGKLQIGYVFSPSHWGNGYASEACLCVMDVLRIQAGVYRIQSFVDVENEASARVLVKSGFIEEARLSRWFRFVNQGNEPKDCILFRLPLS